MGTLVWRLSVTPFLYSHVSLNGLDLLFLAVIFAGFLPVFFADLAFLAAAIITNSCVF